MLIKDKAFTLIELIITITIISILAVIALVRYSSISEKARSAEAYSALAQIVSAENVYQLENNGYTAIANLDIEDPTNSSQNFTFDVTSIDSNSGYASARGINNSQHSYGMCLKNGKKNATACGVNSACDPRCSV